MSVSPAHSQESPAIARDPRDSYLFAHTLGELAKEIERDEVIEGSRAELVSEVLARGDTRELARVLVMHAAPTLDAAELEKAIASNAGRVWCEIVAQLLERRGPDEIVQALRQCAEKSRANAMRSNATRAPTFLRLAAGAMRW